jgi:hypothetical protein
MPIRSHREHFSRCGRRMTARRVLPLTAYGRARRSCTERRGHADRESARPCLLHSHKLPRILKTFTAVALSPARESPVPAPILSFDVRGKACERPSVHAISGGYPQRVRQTGHLLTGPTNTLFSYLPLWRNWQRNCRRHRGRNSPRIASSR